MLTVKLMHGLGNQMFQYAFGRALEKHCGQQVLFDLSWYQKAKQWCDAQGESDGCKIRDYELSEF